MYEESIEMRRPEMRIDTAEQIAIQSSGEVVPVEEIVSLAEKIEQRRPVTRGRFPLEFGTTLLFISYCCWWLDGNGGSVVD